ncbi:MAG: 7-cyano-7-deazaguanine synthase QueC [Thermodesulfovibrionales bacterium]|nr:7-cyano-7-deazaguanine synthase QueC [Thermodesulfovibrionales bacterium]
MQVPKAVVLLSGGIDSSTTLYIAKSQGFELYALSFDYSQKHKRELLSAKMVADSAQVKEHLIVKFDMSMIGKSALTSTYEEVPKDRIFVQDVLKNVQPSIPPTYVPARNTIFLSFALAWAETLMASDIFIGANILDYSGYPDCRPQYLRAFEQMANLATKVSTEGILQFKINAPLLYSTKSETILKGVALGLDYSLTWSCYDPQLKRGSHCGEEKDFEPCKRCDSCFFRARGFEEAGIEDPLLRMLNCH